MLDRKEIWNTVNGIPEKNISIIAFLFWNAFIVTSLNFISQYLQLHHVRQTAFVFINVFLSLLSKCWVGASNIFSKLWVFWDNHILFIAYLHYSTFLILSFLPKWGKSFAKNGQKTNLSLRERNIFSIPFIVRTSFKSQYPIFIVSNKFQYGDRNFMVNHKQQKSLNLCILNLWISDLRILNIWSL